VLAALGARYDPLTGCFQPPEEATFRRVLEALDAAALQAAVGSWLAARRQGGARHPAAGGGGRPSTAFAPLLAPLDLAGAVATADALHAQREHAQFLVTEKNAHYILTIKNNQPSLHAQLKSLPWRQVPAGFDARNKATAAPDGAPSRSPPWPPGPPSPTPPRPPRSGAAEGR
jgi:hypothetical protein